MMKNTPLMDEQEFCMPFPLILDFWTLFPLEEAKGPTCLGSYILDVAVEG